MVYTKSVLSIWPKLIDRLLDEREIKHVGHVHALALETIRDEPVLRLDDRLHVRNRVGPQARRDGFLEHRAVLDARVLDQDRDDLVELCRVALHQALYVVAYAAGVSPHVAE